jgi:GGDEF domain-containing protein
MESSLEAMGSRSHRTLEAVGRLGGDEFVALLPEVSDERDAERVAVRILDLMREPIFVGGRNASSPPAWASRCSRATACRWPT